jgi:hypothetical protein
MTMQEQMAAIRQRALQPRATPPVRLGAFTPVDTTARYFGTDRKTFLLLVLAGLVGGYLLNDAKRATQRTVKRTARRLRGAFKPRRKTVTKPGPGVSVVSIAIAAVAVGGSYYLYKQWLAGQAAPASSSAAPQTVHKSIPLPKINPKTGHWQRPN